VIIKINCSLAFTNNNKKSLHFFTNNFFIKSGSGWILRLYYKVADDSPVMRDLCELACREPFFDLCDVEHNPRLGNASVLYPILWRFLPVIDVQVDLFLSRDLDSRINPREVSNIRIHRKVKVAYLYPILRAKAVPNLLKIFFFLIFNHNHFKQKSI